MAGYQAFLMEEVVAELLHEKDIVVSQDRFVVLPLQISVEVTELKVTSFHHH